MNDITLIMPYYNNTHMLAFHCGVWWSWDEVAKNNISIIVVDDCSNKSPASDVLEPASKALQVDIQLYRVMDDKEWNDVGSRNLGAKRAGSDWLLLTDIDHVVSGKAAHNLVNADISKDNMYYFGRSWANGKTEDAHCNSFLVTRDRFWDAGGYDEDYADMWGGDTEYTKLLQEKAKPECLYDIELSLWQNAMPDGKTPRTDKQLSEWRRQRRAVKTKKRQGVLPELPENPIRFDWERII